jgi:phage shock protein A
MRKTIQELLEPTIKRSIEDRELMDTFKKTTDSMKRKMDEIEYLVVKTQKKTTFFDDLDKKINELDSNIKLCEARSNQDINQVSNQMNTQKFEIQQQQELCEAVEQSVGELKEQISAFNEKMNETKTGILCV